MFRALLALVVLTSACKGDDDDGGGSDPDGGSAGADASGDTPDGGGEAACTFQSAVGVFTVSSSPEFGNAGGSVADVPFPTFVEEKMRDGECAFHGAPFCDPACEGGDICTAGGVCSPFPTNLDAGTVHITGTDPALDLEPQAGPSYYTMENYPDLYQPGDLLTLTGGGDDTDVPAFEATARGVPVLELPTTQLTATEHEDMVVEWDTAGDSPDGAAVVLHMDSDHHGAPGFIECWAADDGEVTVAADLIDAIIAVGESGIGTYIENAYIMRVDAGTDDLGGGDCLVFHTESRVQVSVETVRDE
ncbi:MAG TPA: hypothetical protein VMZ28_01430 [Kofleriaceae bacterium]|nr:hypothetical protein [Kofleriaceae bacterium]